MSGRPEQVFRASPSSYLIMGGILGGIFAFTLWATLFTHPSFWKGAATFGLAFAFALLWLGAFEIRIGDGELRLRSLFGGVKQIACDEILGVRLGFDLRTNGGPLRLFVEQKNGSTTSINAKVFSREAIRAVLDLGESRARADAADLEDGVVMRAVRRRRSKSK